MILENIRLFLRNIKKDIFTNILSTIGLTIGVFVFVIIGQYCLYHMGFDRHHKHSENIYRAYTKTISRPGITNEGINLVPKLLGPEAKEKIPEIVDQTRVSFWKTNFELGDNTIVDKLLYAVDQGFFDIFSWKPIHGNLSEALKTTDKIVLTSSLCESLFGRLDVIGEVVTMQGDPDLYTVSAVIEDPIDRSHFKFDACISFSLLPDRAFDLTWKYNTSTSYFKLSPESSHIEVEKKISELIHGHRDINEIEDYYLQPVREIHLKGDLYGEISENINARDLYVLFLISIAVLLLAAINYVNMTTAKGHNRAREIGLRKTVGAAKKDLASQFYIESFVFTGLSLVLAMILYKSISGIINSRIFDLPELPAWDISMWLGLLGLWVLISILAGFYPAIYLSSLDPVRIIGSSEIKRKGSLGIRKFLIIFQVFVTSILLMTSLVMLKQMKFIKTTDIGFRRDDIIYYSKYSETSKNYSLIKDKLISYPHVQDVTACLAIPGKMRNESEVQVHGFNSNENLNVIRCEVDYNFFDFFEIPVIRGRGFSETFPGDRENSIIVNQTFFKNLNTEHFEGITIDIRGKTKEIAGICKDFHYMPLTSEIQPLVIELLDNNNSAKAVAVKLADTSDKTVKDHIDELITINSGGLPAVRETLSTDIEGFYESSRKLLWKINMLTLIALIISIFGMSGLANFFCNGMKRSILVRKVFGANRNQLFYLLNKPFLLIIFFTNLAAFPFVIYLLSKWLNNYAYHVSIDVMVFIIVLFFSAFTGFFAIVIQLAKLVNTSPANITYRA